MRNEVVTAVSIVLLIVACGGERAAPPISEIVTRSSDLESSDHVLRIRVPQSGAVLRDTATEVRGIFPSDVSGVLVNGQPATVVDGEFHVESLALREGANPITAKARSSMGTDLADSLTVFADWTPPTITFPGLPANEARVCSAILTPRNVVVEDLNPGTREITLNQKSIDGLTPLRVPGEYSLRVRAVDAVGNKTEAVRIFHVSDGPECAEMQKTAAYFDQHPEFLQGALDQLLSGKSSTFSLGTASDVSPLLQSGSNTELDPVLSFFILGPSDSPEDWRATVAQAFRQPGFDDWLDDTARFWSAGSSPGKKTFVEAIPGAFMNEKTWKHLQSQAPTMGLDGIQRLAERAEALGWLEPLGEMLQAKKAGVRSLEGMAHVFQSPALAKTSAFFSAGGDITGLEAIGELLNEADFSGPVFGTLATMSSERFNSIGQTITKLSRGGGDSDPSLAELFTLAGEVRRRNQRHRRSSDAHAFAPFFIHSTECDASGNCLPISAERLSSMEAMLASLDESHRPLTFLGATIRASASEHFLNEVAKSDLKTASDSTIMDGMKLVARIPGACSFSREEMGRWSALASHVLSQPGGAAPFEGMVRALRGEDGEENLIHRFLETNRRLLKSGLYSQMRLLLGAASQTGLMDQYLEVLGRDASAAQSLARVARLVAEPIEGGRTVGEEWVRLLKPMAELEPVGLGQLLSRMTRSMRESPQETAEFLTLLSQLNADPGTGALSRSLYPSLRLEMGGQSLAIPDGSGATTFPEWLSQSVREKRFAPFLKFLARSASSRAGQVVPNRWREFVASGAYEKSRTLFRQLASGNSRAAQEQFLGFVRNWAEASPEEARALQQLAKDGMLASSLRFAVQLLP